MEIHRLRKKPVVVEAARFDGTAVSAAEIADWCGGRVDVLNGARVIVIETLEGEMCASSLDWVIKGVAGEFYPVKQSILADTYEDVCHEPADL